jgi:uncharacterized protein (TIGR03089 family)
MVPTTPQELLSAALRRSPATPLITYYDDATGERTELSATTLANWVAKTANLLQDEFDVGPGSTVPALLPPHWQTAAVLLGVWSCGAAVQESSSPADATGLAVVAQDRLAAFEDEGDADHLDVLGVSLHPLGLGMRDYSGAARDFALEVRTHGDVFTPYAPVDPAGPGLVLGGGALTLEALTGAAGELAGRLGIAAGDRVLVDDRLAEEAGPVTWLLAPLAAGASLVLVRQPDPGALARRAATEGVTATLGPRVDGIRRLGEAR